MNSIHREFLIFFFLRKGMYVNPVNRDTVVSFLAGYECGQREHMFIPLLKETLTNKYKLPYSNTGWIGQMDKLAEREGDTWVNALTKLSLFILCEQEEELTEKSKEFLKHAISAKINQSDWQPHFKSWENDWATFSFLKHKWVKTLWTPEEWKVITRIDKLVKARGVYKPVELTPEMATLTERWERMKEK